MRGRGNNQGCDFEAINHAALIDGVFDIRAKEGLISQPNFSVSLSCCKCVRPFVAVCFKMWSSKEVAPEMGHSS